MKQVLSNIRRIKRNAGIRYKVEVQVSGRRYRKTFAREWEAIAHRDELIRQIGCPSRIGTEFSVRSRIKDLFCLYLNNGKFGKGWGNRHFSDVKRKFEIHVGPIIGNVFTKDFNYRHVGVLRDELVKKGVSPFSVNRVLTLFGTFLTWAAEEKYLPSISVRRYKVIDSVQREEIVIWSDDQIRHFIELGYRFYGPTPELLWIPTLYHFALQTGLRYGEIAALRWQDINLENRYVSVNRAWDSKSKEFKVPKTKTSVRKVPLSRSLIKKLRELFGLKRPAPATLLFCFFSDLPFSLSPFTRKHLKKDVERSDLPNIHFHGLRHCFGTSLARNGTPVSMIMRLMGHSVISTTMRYIKLAAMDSELPKQIEKIDRIGPCTDGNNVIFVNQS